MSDVAAADAPEGSRTPPDPHNSTERTREGTAEKKNAAAAAPLPPNAAADAPPASGNNTTTTTEPNAETTSEANGEKRDVAASAGANAPTNADAPPQPSSAEAAPPAPAEEPYTALDLTRLPGSALRVNDQMMLWDVLFSPNGQLALVLADRAPLRIHHVVDPNTNNGSGAPVRLGRVEWESPLSASGPVQLEAGALRHLALLPSGSLVFAQAFEGSLDAGDAVQHHTVLWSSPAAPVPSEHAAGDATVEATVLSYVAEMCDDGRLRVREVPQTAAVDAPTVIVWQSSQSEPKPAPPVEQSRETATVVDETTTPTKQPQHQEEAKETPTAASRDATSPSPSPSPQQQNDTRETEGVVVVVAASQEQQQPQKAESQPPPERLPKQAFVGDRIYVDDPLYCGSYLLCPSREFGFVIRRDGNAVVFRNAAPPRDYSAGRTRWVKPGTEPKADDFDSDTTIGDIIYELPRPAPAPSDSSAVEQDKYEHEYQLALLRDGDAVFSHFVLESSANQPNPDASGAVHQPGTTPPVAVLLSEVWWTSKTAGSRATHLALRDDGALVIAAPPRDENDFYGVHAHSAAHEIVWASTPASALVPFRSESTPSRSPSKRRSPSSFRQNKYDDGTVLTNVSTESTDEVLQRLKAAALQYSHVKVPSNFSPRRQPPSRQQQHQSQHVASPHDMGSVTRKRQSVAERTAEFHSHVLYDQRAGAPSPLSEDEKRAAVTARVMSRRSAADAQPPRVNRRSPARTRLVSRTKAAATAAASNVNRGRASPQRHVVASGDIDVYV